MSDPAIFATCAGRWPLLALCALLAPLRSEASPPIDASAPEVSAGLPREAVTGSWRPNEAHRAPVTSAKIRIGRIFFSPAERRQRRAEKTPAPDASIPSRAIHGERIVVSGAVSSSTQGRAVWINGAAVENSASVWTDRAGRVWLRDDSKTPHLTRPGQALNPATGAMEDLLPAGAVVRH